MKRDEIYKEIILLLEKLPASHNRSGMLMDLAHAFGMACTIYTAEKLGHVKGHHLEDELVEVGNECLGI